MPKDKTTTVDIEKDGKSYRINVPSSYLGEVDKDGNATITNAEGFRAIMDQEISNKTGPGKSPSSKQHYNVRTETPYYNKFPISVFKFPKYLDPKDTTPIYDKVLGVGEDALTLGSLFFTPEVAALAKAKPLLTLGSAAAGYGITKLGEELGLSPEESEGAGIVAGGSILSPKLRGAITNAVRSVNVMRGGIESALGGLAFGRKGAEIAPLITEIPAAIRGFLTGGANKPYLEPELTNRLSFGDLFSNVKPAGYKSGVEFSPELKGAYNQPSGYEEKYLAEPQKLLTAPEEGSSNKFNVRSGGDELPFTPKKAAVKKAIVEESKTEESKPKRTVTRKPDEEKKRLKGYQKTAEKAGKTVRKVLRTDKTKDQRTAEDLVKGLEEGRTYTDEGEEKAPIKKQEEPDKPKRIVKRTTKSSIKTKKEEKVKETEKPKEETKPEIKTQSDIEEHANNNGIGTDEAEKQLKDEGHVVLNRQQLNRAVHGLARQKGLTHQDISDMASTAHNVDSLTKLTDKQLHEIFKYIDQLPDKKLETTNKSNLNKEGKPNTKDDLIDKLKESLKRVKKTDK